MTRVGRPHVAAEYDDGGRPARGLAQCGAEIRRVAGASLLGSVVEWYDFFLYGTMAALVFNSQFFPTFDPSSAR